MVLDREREHPLRWATVVSIAAEIGCAGQRTASRRDPRGEKLEPIISAALPGSLVRWSVIGAVVLGTVVDVLLCSAVLAALVTRWKFTCDGVGNDELPDWRSGLFVGDQGPAGSSPSRPR